MDWLQVFILSIVQGITEFLPISSSAHLIIVPTLTGWVDQGILFDLSVHLGTLGAVMLYFKKDTCALMNGAGLTLIGKWQHIHSKLFIQLSLATLPLLVVAALFKNMIELSLRGILPIAIASIVFGLLLYMADKKEEVQKTTITLKDAFVFGLFQAIALIPGTSRSGITMTAGRFLGFSRTQSAHFSMLMAIPVILILSLYAILNAFTAEKAIIQQASAAQLFVGIGFSFLTAYFAIGALMTFVNKIGFLPFVTYRILLGIFLLGWFYLV